eukprot:gene10811-2892_t
MSLAYIKTRDTTSSKIYSIVLCLLILFGILITSTVRAETPRLSELIYTKLTGNDDLNSCTRLLSVDKVIGCSSPITGSTGAIFHIGTKVDLNNFKHASHPSYIVLLHQDMFADANITETLLSFKKYKGALIYSPANATADPWSPDDKAPNANFGLEMSSNHEWNLIGGGYGKNKQEGAHWQNFGTRPIFYLTPQDRDLVFERLKANGQLGTINPGYPLVGAELRNFMWAAKDAQTCLRRKFCDPLRSHNIWGTIQEYNTSHKVIMASAQMDTLAFFHDQAIGANADASGLIALLAAARVLGDEANVAIRSAARNIMFMLFNGEAFGYIGSSKMAYQMTRKKSNFPTATLPLTFEQVSQYLEVGQLLSGGDQLSAYAFNTFPDYSVPVPFQNTRITPFNPLLERSSGVQRAITSLQAAAQNSSFGLNITYEEGEIIPPASLRMILHELRDDDKREDFGGLFLTDHSHFGFTNQYYHSRLDNADYIRASSNETINKLCDIASIIARSLWDLAFDEPPKMPVDQADCNYVRSFIVKELLYCITVNQTCQLVKDSVIVTEPTPTPMKRYVGTKAAVNTLTREVGFFFNQLAAAIAIDRNVTFNETDGCTATGRPPSFQRIRWRGNNQCFKSAVFTHLAWSPAFDGYYSLKSLGSPGQQYRDGRDPRWSTWTESTWDPIRARIFFVDNPSSQLATVLVALLWLFISFGTVYYLHSRIEYHSHTLLEPENN